MWAMWWDSLREAPIIPALKSLWERVRQRIRRIPRKNNGAARRGKKLKFKI